MIAAIFAIAQTLAPTLADNQWRPQDVAHSWPLSSDWSVIYWHGDEQSNGTPPAVTYSWHCHLYEPTKIATCISSWEIRAGTTCRMDRALVPWEHPLIWYEKYRGDGSHATESGKRLKRSRAFFWAYRQGLSAWPEWSNVPRHAWEYDRIQWIPSGPNCYPTGGCSSRALYYIQESPGFFALDEPEKVSKQIPPGTSPMSPLDGHHVCRGFLYNQSWCGHNPSRPECGPPAQAGA